MPATLTPFTYYRSADNRRAFLLAEVWQPAGYPDFDPAESYVLLVEWGHTRPTRVALATFQQQIQDGKLLPFTPKL